MSKKPSTKRARRPRSIYAKGWETRRRLKAATQESIKMMGEALERAADASEARTAAELNQTFFGDKAQAAPTPPFDPMRRLLDLTREEQLCCFMGDMQTMRQMRVPLHAPIVVSRSQVEAIEDFLRDHGYSMFGKGSGAFASVSTKATKD